MKIEFEKQFGQGVDPWHAKAKRWETFVSLPISLPLHTKDQHLDQIVFQILPSWIISY